MLGDNQYREVKARLEILGVTNTLKVLKVIKILDNIQGLFNIQNQLM